MVLTILFDFDGVIADTNQIRLQGFLDLYNKEHPKRMDAYVDYLEKSHGVSRYEKIRYLYHDILNTDVSEKEVLKDAVSYSKLVKQKIMNATEIEGSTFFLKEYHDKAVLGLISASDGKELIDVCKSRNIDKYFDEIMGSPIKKVDNINTFIKKRGINKNNVVYVGDSLHDEAASYTSGVSFIGFGEKSSFSAGSTIAGSYIELEKIINCML